MGNLLVRSVSSRQQLHPRLDNEDGAGDPSESMREGDGQGEKLQSEGELLRTQRRKYKPDLPWADPAANARAW